MATSLQREQTWDTVIGSNTDSKGSSKWWVAIKKIKDIISTERSWIVVLELTVIGQNIRYEWVKEVIHTHVQHSRSRRQNQRGGSIAFISLLFLSYIFFIPNISLEPVKFYWALNYFWGHNDVDCLSYRIVRAVRTLPNSLGKDLCLRSPQEARYAFTGIINARRNWHRNAHFYRAQ